MELFYAGTTPSPQLTLDTFVFEQRLPRLHSYLNEANAIDTFIYNCMREHILEKVGEPFKYMGRREIEIYFAGDGYSKSCEFIFGSGFNRLLSYVNNRRRAEKYVANRAFYEEVDPNMELYLVGDSAGFPEVTPEKLVKSSNVLISYGPPRGKRSIDEAINSLKEEAKALMDLFLVGPEKENIMSVAIEELKSNMLFNYIDGKKATDKYKDKILPRKLFIDSGAFSAWTKGKTIDVDEYIAWINERADFISLYGQIDVIPGDIVKGHTPEQVKEAARLTWENYLYMRPRMKKPEGLLYTFHVGEPYDYLRQALEWRDEQGKPIPYIALGGMVGKPGPVRKNFLDTCFNIIKKSTNPDVKVHAFGMTSFELLAQYPGITSADSTSWIMTGANGMVMTDVGNILVSDKQSNLLSHYSHLSKELRDAFDKNIAEFGFTLDELAASRDNRIMHNARFMNKRAKNLVYQEGPKRKSLF